MANTAEVVRYLRRKSSNGFDEPITYLGAEQRFVGALRNSGVNNLEEQYIIGTDTYTQTYKNEDNNTVVEKEFHVNDGTEQSGYYKLVSVIYENVFKNEDYFFEDAEFKMPYSTKDIVFDGEDLKCENPEIFVYGTDDLRVVPSSFTKVREDNLYFVKNIGVEILVLTKTTGRRYADNGTREIVKESIINHLQA